MKQGRAGCSLVAACLIAALAAGNGSCGRKLMPVRPPPVLIDGGLTFTVNYQTFTMRNGLVVVLAPDDESNLVTVDMRYFVGAAGEPAGKTGLAHLAEHLTFESLPALPEEGAPPQPQQTLTTKLGESALSFNARTSFDSTHYYSVGLAPSLEGLLAAEAQRMTAPCERISDELFARERTVVMQELAQRAESSDPVKALHALVWGAAHPFAHGVGGDDLASLTRADYCAFTAANYHPTNATLVVGGKIDPGRVLRLIAKHFDRIPHRDDAPRAAVPGLPPPGAPLMSTAISVEKPTAMLVFPLQPVGGKARVLQEVMLSLVETELSKRVADQDALHDGKVIVLGGKEQGAAGLLLSGDLKYPQLFAELRAAIDEALELEEGPKIQFLQAAMLTELARRHDSMLSRGTLIGDHSQFNRDAEYASEAEIYAHLQATELKDSGERTFRSSEARSFTFQKSQKKEREQRNELANVGDSFTTELPRRAQLSSAVSSSLALSELTSSYKPVDFKLSNGLRVILVPRRAEAFFEARFVLPIGDADDPEGRAGLAELTALMLSPPRSNLAFNEALMLQMGALSGSRINASTAAHTTTFRVRGVPSQAIMHLWRLHVLLESGTHEYKDLEQLRELWAERERQEQQLSGDPDVVAEKRKARLWQALLGKMLGESYPYLRDRSEELRQITVDELSAFRDAHYRSDGAVLVVVGGFDRAEIEREIYGLWGAWQKQTVPASNRLPPARPVQGPSYLALDRPDSQVSLSLAYWARSDADKDAGAQLVAAELLSDRVAEIRERMAATYGLDVEYMRLAGTSFVVVQGRVAPDRVVSVLAALRQAWKMDRDGAGQLALEVARARRRALQRALARSSSSASIADSIAELAVGGGALDAWHRQLAAIAAVTTEQVRAVIEGDLDDRRMTVAASGPGAREILKSAGAARVEQIQ